MNGATIPILVALVIQLALGVAVFQANRHRKPNQCFLALSLAASGWLGSLYFAFTAKNPLIAEYAIRVAFGGATLIPVGCNILRLSIGERKRGWRFILRQSRVWLLVTAAIVCLCLTKFFLSGVVILPQIDHGPASRPIYGPGFLIHPVFFAVSLLILIINYVRDLRQTSGGERAELAFILIGATSTIVFSILANTVFRFFVEPTQLIWFAPFRPVVFSLVIAYGVATRKIMDVGLFLRRTISYVLLTIYRESV